MLKRMKKGFTLAELLIVVAIIAVLTAIAVPLFVSSVSRAQKATFDANVSAVKSAVIVAIISDESFKVEDKFTSDEPVLFTAKVTKDGVIGAISEAAAEAKVTATYQEWQDSESITVGITRTDLTKVNAAGAGA